MCIALGAKFEYRKHHSLFCQRDGWLQLKLENFGSIDIVILAALLLLSLLAKDYHLAHDVQFPSVHDC